MNLDRKSDSKPRPAKSSHLNWELFSLWSSVVFTIAAFFVAGYLIWAKCHGR